MSENQRKAIDSLAEIAKELVDNAHARPQLSQNHYAEYMAIISKLTEQSKRDKHFWGVVLMVAGADEIGVKAAVKNL